ncbi:MAG: hypothetical protein H6584_01135 [Flavobacteriales bacterium]|nr:hypothetical protein [Flavobacteriales bacterium]
MHIQVIIGLIGVVSGFIMGYFTSYFKEKGRNKALIQDLKEITEEKEKVTSKFQLDISKRKYKYEDKREQYFKYFNLLDSFTSDNQKIAQESFIPALNKFNEMFLGANGNKTIEMKATSDFATAVNNLMFKSNESLIKLKQETNTIKLIAGTKVSTTLKELEIAYDNSMDQSAKMMKDLTKNLISRNVDQLSKQKEDIEITGEYLKSLQERLMKEVRDELDEI